MLKLGYEQTKTRTHTMPVGRPKSKATKPNENLVKSSRIKYAMEKERARSIDDLALHDELFMGILGTLKTDIAKGLTTEQILKKYASLAAARTVSTALTHENAGLALAASKEVLDRAHGKATEHKKIEHALANADEKEVDALLISKLKELDEVSDESE